MGFEKLTYGGSQSNNYLYFSFDGEYFDVSIITKELGIEPTSVRLKKDPIPKKTSWYYKIDAGKKIDLRDEIEKLVNLFKSKIDIIVKLKSELNLRTRLQFVLYVDIDPQASTPCFPLGEKTIDFLGKTQSIVDFDLYKSDKIGLLNK